jgi:hypothetical protein
VRRRKTNPRRSQKLTRYGKAIDISTYPIVHGVVIWRREKLSGIWQIGFHPVHDVRATNVDSISY